MIEGIYHSAAWAGADAKSPAQAGLLTRSLELVIIPMVACGSYNAPQGMSSMDPATLIPFPFEREVCRNSRRGPLGEIGLTAGQNALARFPYRLSR